MQSVLQICSGTEWEFDMKKKLIQATCLFFVMMLIFTILSRVSDSVNVIQIQTKNPANQMITHEVKGSGKVEGSQEVAVFVLENLQVEQVMVHTQPGYLDRQLKYCKTGLLHHTERGISADRCNVCRTA